MNVGRTPSWNSREEFDQTMLATHCIPFLLDRKFLRKAKGHRCLGGGFSAVIAQNPRPHLPQESFYLGKWRKFRVRDHWLWTDKKWLYDIFSMGYEDARDHLDLRSTRDYQHIKKTDQVSNLSLNCVVQKAKCPELLNKGY